MKLRSNAYVSHAQEVNTAMRKKQNVCALLIPIGMEKNVYVIKVLFGMKTILIVCALIDNI